MKNRMLYLLGIIPRPINKDLNYLQYFLNRKLNKSHIKAYTPVELSSHPICKEIGEEWEEGDYLIITDNMDGQEDPLGTAYTVELQHNRKGEYDWYFNLTTYPDPPHIGVENFLKAVNTYIKDYFES